MKGGPLCSPFVQCIAGWKAQFNERKNTKLTACSALPTPLFFFIVLPKLNFCASVLQHDTFGTCCGDLNKNDDLSTCRLCQVLSHVGKVFMQFLPNISYPNWIMTSLKGFHVSWHTEECCTKKGYLMRAYHLIWQSDILTGEHSCTYSAWDHFSSSHIVIHMSLFWMGNSKNKHIPTCLKVKK